MQALSQRDPRWSGLKLGSGKLTLSQAGCYITCHAMREGTTPDKINELFKKKGVFNVDMLKHPDDARALGYDSYQISYGAPKFNCIAEVDFNPDPAKQQHFVVWLGDGNILDPWDGLMKDQAHYIKYLSWRIYNKKQPATSVEATPPPTPGENMATQIENLNTKIKNQADMINAYMDKIKNLTDENERLKAFEKNGTAAIGVLKAIQIAIKSLLEFKF